MGDLEASGKEEGEPVTVVLTWDVARGHEDDFEEWAKEVNQVASRFPGHLGATWFRPEGAGNRYYTVVQFADEARHKTWLDSPERRDMIRRVRGIASEDRHHTTGLETWFSLPGQDTPAPARWKMALATFAAVFPLNLAFQAFVSTRVQPWPLPLRAMTFPLVMVPLLTYLVMPNISRVLRRWLYHPEHTHPPAEPDEEPGSS